MTAKMSIYYDSACCLKNYKSNQHENLAQYGDHEIYTLVVRCHRDAVIQYFTVTQYVIGTTRILGYSFLFA